MDSWTTDMHSLRSDQWHLVHVHCTATNATGTGTASTTSNAVTPNPASFNVTLNIATGQSPLGATATITGSDLLPGSTVTVTLHSTPMVLGTGTVAADGSFSLAVTIPTTTPAGTHMLTATGTAADGSAATESISFALAAVTVPATGNGALLFAVSLMLVAGLVLLLAARRKARRIVQH